MSKSMKNESDFKHRFEKDLIKLLEKYKYIDHSKFLIEGVNISTSIDSMLKVDILGLIARG